MISTHWLNQRSPHWKRLEQLLDQIAGAGLKSLTRSELQELGLLYRQIAADLATVREDAGGTQFAAYLNHLLARAHNTIYSAGRPAASGLLLFFRETFPQTFRATSRYTLTALLLVVAGAAVGAALTLVDPDFKTKVLSPEMIESIERRQMWTHSIVSVKPIASSAIMTNNLSVSFMAFAMGITGIGTIYILALNGVLLGVVGTTCALAGMSVPLWSFVAPHGVLELPAIFIAGGAGLRLAHGLFFPGFLPRRASLALAGREAVQLIFGCIPILVIAGVIEAFISPTALSVGLKFGIAGALFLLFLRYLLWRR